MGYILAIESATKVCSVAIYKDFECLDALEYHGDYSHAEKLAEFASQLLKKQQIDKFQLTAIAVSKGPGSYTGLRIGVAFAKGLCFSLSIPLIAINTLEALAYKAIVDFQIKEAFIVPMIDARRMEVYNAIYDHRLKTIEEIKATILEPTTFDMYLKQTKVYCVGDGSFKFNELKSHNNLEVHHDCLPSARFFGPQIKKRYDAAQFEDLAYFEPYYLKDFIALKSKPMI